jgi:cytochrome c-type biogenesis protein CcmE
VRAHRAVDAVHLAHHRGDRRLALLGIVGPQLDTDRRAHDGFVASLCERPTGAQIIWCSVRGKHARHMPPASNNESPRSHAQHHPARPRPDAPAMKPRHKRIGIIVGALAGLGIAAGLVLNALQSNVAFFFTPTQVTTGEAPKNRTFRVGGMVRQGSLQRDQMTVRFVITDTAKDVAVSYTGILPDLFKEGKGVVAAGQARRRRRVRRDEVLAKHDENYMPPEAKLRDRAKRRRAER